MTDFIRKMTICITALLLSFTSHSQTSFIWGKQFGTNQEEYVRNHLTGPDGKIYITGNTRGDMAGKNFGKNDGFITKIDTAGNTVWSRQFGTDSPDVCTAVTGDKKGKIYVSGSTFGHLGSESKGFMDGFAGQFSEDLKPLKFTQFGSDGFDIPASILIDSDLNLYAGGTTSGNFADKQLGEGDCFLIKITNSGDVLWSKQFGTVNHDGIKSIAFNPEISENILVSGLFNLPPAHAFVRMYTRDGNLVWEKNFIPEGDSRDASGKDVSIDNSGNIYHLGLTQSNLFSNLIGVTDFYLVKMKLRNALLSPPN